MLRDATGQTNTVNKKKPFLYLVLYIFLYFLEEKKTISKLFSCYTDCATDTMKRNVENYIFFYMIVRIRYL